jgi:hypothetical protein
VFKVTAIQGTAVLLDLGTLLYEVLNFNFQFVTANIQLIKDTARVTGLLYCCLIMQIGTDAYRYTLLYARYITEKYQFSCINGYGQKHVTLFSIHEIF